MGSLSKYKILVITGTRAEYGLLKSTIDAIQSSKFLSLCLVVTGMHTLKRFGYSIKEIENDGIKIDYTISLSESDDMLNSLGKEIKGIKDICVLEKPEAVLVLGDRDEPFAGAIVGGHLKIPVFHIHGGDISGYSVDQYIRDSITKFSHLHFTASKKSYDRVIKSGEERWRVFNVGAPGLDNLKKEKYLSRKKLAEKLDLNINKKWLIVLQHPTPLDKINIYKQISPTLKVVSDLSAEKIVIYPNSDTGADIFINEIQRHKKDRSFHIYKNFDRLTYLSLLKSCDLLVGNSSSGIIESGFFCLPIVNIGNRQLGRECGRNIIHTDYTQKQIKTGILFALTTKFRHLCNNQHNPYGNGGVGKKIVKIIEKNISKPELFYKKFI